MNKLFFAVLILFALPLYAQEEAPLELSDEGVETNPLESADQPVESPIVETETEPEIAPSETEVTDTAEETVAPAETEEKVETAETEGSAVDEFVPPANAEAVANLPEHKLEEELDTRKRFNQRESHWVTTFGFEHTKYEVVAEERFEFQGKKDFEKDFQELWGGRLGFGGEVYLGAGFVTRSMIEGYYVGTLFSRVLNGGREEEDIKFAYTKRTGQLFGFDASQSLGWMFDFKTKNPFIEEWSYLTVEPFIEAGVGRAWAYNRINYSYKLDTTDEEYRLRVRDDLLNARIGAGINLTSNQGFFLSLRATVNRMDITKRKIDGYTRENGQSSRTTFNESNNDAKIDPIVIYTLGGGYKF